MKKILSVSAIAAMTVISLTGCWGNPESASPVPAPKEAKNVEIIQVPGNNGFKEVVVFDIERDGQILTCTTKMGYNSGVSCGEKAKQ